MLVLTRMEEQEIVVNGPAVIRIVRVAKGRVKLSFDAPEETKILRGELKPRDEGSAT